jgi:hypothetical protein
MLQCGTRLPLQVLRELIMLAGLPFGATWLRVQGYDRQRQISHRHGRHAAGARCDWQKPVGSQKEIEIGVTSRILIVVTFTSCGYVQSVCATLSNALKEFLKVTSGRNC